MFVLFVERTSQFAFRSSKNPLCFALLDGNPHFLEARGKTFACHCSQTLHSNNNKILIDLFVIAAAMWIALSIQQIASIVIPPPIYIYVFGQGL